MKAQAEAGPLEVARPRVSATELPPEFCYPAAKRALDSHQPEFAAALCRRHLMWKPDDGKGYRMLGFCAFLLGRGDEAVQMLNRAVELRPNDVQAALMLGACLFTIGQNVAGEAHLERALTLQADSPYKLAMLAETQLLFGDYENGWPNLEARWSTPRLSAALPFVPSESYPLWDGSPLLDRPLCVHSEGGFGDAIMFSRFAPLLASKVRELYFVVPRALERLLQGVPGVRGIIVRRDRIPDRAVHTSFWSMPAHARVRVSDLPGPYRHLTAASEGFDLGPRTRPRVGLVWAGSPKTAHNVHRSVPDVELLRPLLDAADVEWISLQFGERAGEAERLPVRTVSMPGDWAETGYLVQQLDLVISVDTAVAHLAGSFDVPTWIVLPSIPEFRWMLRRDDTPWYPSARLFQRTGTHDWEERVAHLARELATHFT